MQKIIFHIDVNSAFLSWTAVEMLANGSELDIREIPSIIGGDQQSRHGIVLAKSIPAKKYGIQTGEPVAQAFRKCPNLHMEPPDHKMYRQYSARLMDFLRTYTNEIEQVSVDECYLDFTGIAEHFPSPVEAAMEIKQKVLETFGFTVNIGISNNKLLAKMASDFEKPNRVHTLFPEEIRVKMWPLPVGELFMAGKSSVEVLHKLEIHTIGELARTDPALLELHLKSHGRTLWEFANGIGAEEVRTEERVAKGIGNSITLSKDASTREEAEKVLYQLTKKVCKRLKTSGQKAGMVSVEIRYSTFQNTSHQRQLKKATDDPNAVYNEVCALFAELWSGAPIRLLGVRTSKLVEETQPEQMTIFDIQPVLEEVRTEKEKREKHQKLSEVMNQINKRYGEDAIMRGTDRKQ